MDRHLIPLPPGHAQDPSSTRFGALFILFEEEKFSFPQNLHCLKICLLDCSRKCNLFDAKLRL